MFNVSTGMIPEPKLGVAGWIMMVLWAFLLIIYIIWSLDQWKGVDIVILSYGRPMGHQSHLSIVGGCVSLLVLTAICVAMQFPWSHTLRPPGPLGMAVWGAVIATIILVAANFEQAWENLLSYATDKGW